METTWTTNEKTGKISSWDNTFCSSCALYIYLCGIVSWAGLFSTPEHNNNNEGIVICVVGAVVFSSLFIRLFLHQCITQHTNKRKESSWLHRAKIKPAFSMQQKCCFVKKKTQQWNYSVPCSWRTTHLFIKVFTLCVWTRGTLLLLPGKNIMCAMRHTTKILKKETTFPKSAT